MLRIGDEDRPAAVAGVGRSTSGESYVHFRYSVQASDRDDDGISIPANALTLNGGSIKDTDGNDADLSHDAVPDDPNLKVNGSLDATPTVTRVYVNRPSSGDTYGPGDEVLASVNFSGPVAVTGEPRLVLRIGDQNRSTDLFNIRSDSLRFRYFVKASDHDDDGISIPANAVLLNRGSIRSVGGSDADLSHEAVPDDPEAKVDGRLDAVPTITRVSRLGRPRQGGVYGPAERFGVGVRFSERVVITGTPQVAIQVGTQTRQADLHFRRDSTLYFYYDVQPSDVDTDGFSVPADALALNGGSIRDADGNDADLAHDALPDDPGHKVDGTSGGVPAVRGVAFARWPASQDTYVAGETVFVYVYFTRNVRVTGAPQLALQVGATMRRADHLPRFRAAELLPPVNGFHLPGESEDWVTFEYVVRPSDVDDDGVSIPANALILNGGSIRAKDDSDVDLSHEAVADDPTRKVDGSRSDDQAPTALLWVEPPPRGAFGRGDAIAVQVRLSEGVTVTGAPRVALGIGAATRFATFRESWGTTTLLFEYVVEETDRDDDGISIAADAVDLNGGTIRDNGGNDADLDLGYRAFDDDPNYRVDGRLTPVPALPLGGALALLLALLGGGWRRLARHPRVDGLAR